MRLDRLALMAQCQVLAGSGTANTFRRPADRECRSCPSISVQAIPINDRDWRVASFLKQNFIILAGQHNLSPASRADA
ncbi:hypothetical protein ACFQS6_18005 [Xanthomonas populi]|uniref:hypothetical protein n=1 Tax=Xanthomonas populi TaxID=53414 RepID=UPI000FF88FC2|nr:hypothetical protein [Xanthomonas populi]